MTSRWLVPLSYCTKSIIDASGATLQNTLFWIPLPLPSVRKLSWVSMFSSLQSKPNALFDSFSCFIKCSISRSSNNTESTARGLRHYLKVQTGSAKVQSNSTMGQVIFHNSMHHLNRGGRQRIKWADLYLIFQSLFLLDIFAK